MEQSIQIFILGYSSRNSCFSCKGAIAFAISICYHPMYHQAGRGILLLTAFFPACQAGSYILLTCRQDLRKRKCFRSMFLVLKELLGMQEGIQQFIWVLWVSSVCGVNSALPGFMDKVGTEGKLITQDLRSRLQGQYDKPDSKRQAKKTACG